MGRKARANMAYSLILPSIQDCLEECPSLLSPGRKQVSKQGHMSSPRGTDQRLRPHKSLHAQQASKHQLGLGAGLQNLHKTRTHHSPSSTSPRGYSSSSGSSSSTRHPRGTPPTPTNTTTSKAHKGFSSSSGSSSSSNLSGSNSGGSNSSSSCELDTTMRALSIRDAQTTPARQHAAAAAAAFVAAAAVAAAGQHQQPLGLNPGLNLNSDSNPKAGVNLKSLCQLQQEGDAQPLQQTGSSKSPPAFIAAVAAAAAAGAVDLRAVKQLTDSAAFSVAPISPKWPPTVSADGTCIPAAHNIHLSPRDTGSTIFSSVTSLATPQAAEAAAAVTAAAAAAEAAAGRLKSVVPAAAVPESLLTAADQRVKTLVAIEAVRSCRSHSAPECLIDRRLQSSHSSRGGTTSSASTAAAAAAAAAGRTTASGQQRSDAQDSSRSKHYRTGSALRPPLHLTPWQAKSPKSVDPSTTSATSTTPKQTPSQPLHRQPWQQQQQQLTLPLPPLQQQQPALEQQQQFGSSAGSYGRRSGHSARGRAAAPEMTAKAAALFSTVASSVQRDLLMWQGGRVSQTPRLLRGQVSPAYVSQRTDRWVSEVAKFMVDSGILPAHRVFVYMLRPVRPPPTRWQCVQKTLGKPMYWIEARFGKKARARARALKRVAGY